MKVKVFVVAVIFICIAVGCNKTDDEQIKNEKKAEQISDANKIVDLKVEVSENTVKIGEQIWMRKNLDVRKFNNGDPINFAFSNQDWQDFGETNKPAAGYYENEKKNGELYGLIYNWQVIADKRGICPEGWSVPTNDDWKKLIEYLGGEKKAGLFLRDSLGWGEGLTGNNLSGFSALPGGFRGYDGVSYSVEYMARFWTSTVHSEFFAYGWDIVSDAPGITQSVAYKQDGYSIRLIKK